MWGPRGARRERYLVVGQVGKVGAARRDLARCVCDSARNERIGQQHTAKTTPQRLCCIRDTRVQSDPEETAPFARRFFRYRHRIAAIETPARLRAQLMA